MPRPYDSDTAKAPDKACRRGQEASGEWPYLPLSLQPVLAAPQESLQLLARIGVPSTLQWPLFCAASAWDVVLGVCCLSPLARRRALWIGQAVTVIAYTLIVAGRLPEAWAHPFARLVKNLPILALICHLARRIP